MKNFVGVRQIVTVSLFFTLINASLAVAAPIFFWYPDSTRTVGFGINASDTVVGYIENKNRDLIGFIYSGGHFQEIVAPNAFGRLYGTVLTAINDHGVAVGYYYDSASAGAVVGFIYDQGNIIEIKSGTPVIPTSISNSGIVAGYAPYDGAALGFFYDPHSDSIDFIGRSGFDRTFITGGTSDGNSYVAYSGTSAFSSGSILEEGTFIDLPMPGDATVFNPRDINTDGYVLGTAQPDGRFIYSFLLVEDIFYQFDLGWNPFAINDLNIVTGAYGFSGINRSIGFISDVSDPSGILSWSRPDLADYQFSNGTGTVSEPHSLSLFLSAALFYLFIQGRKHSRRHKFASLSVDQPR